MPQTNLGLIPALWGSYPLLGDVCYNGGVQITHLDYAVLHNGHASIRIDPHTSADVNTAREVDAEWVTVHGGQRIVFRCWMKTSSSSLGENALTDKGSRLGIEFYNSSGKDLSNDPVIGPIVGMPKASAGSCLPFGSADWAFWVYDFIVPNGYDITGCLPWLQVHSSAGEQGIGWFADAEFYVLNAGEEPPPPIGTTPPPVSYVLDVWAAEGGTTTPTGLNSYPSGIEVTITATAAEGYVFSGWLVNNQPRSENPLTLTITQNLTVMPIFNAVPTPPEPPPSGNNVIAAGAAIATVVAAVLFAVTR